MTKIAKISIAMVVAVLLIAGTIVSVLLLTGGKEPGLPNVDRTTKLSAPKNIVIDDDWVLSFDRVDNAIGYQVVIDGSKIEIIQNNSLDVSSYASIGLHSFSVRAMHNLASYHSELSDPVYKAKTMQLSTPGNVSLSGTLFSWGQVSEAKSYELMIVDGDNRITYFYASVTEYSLAEYLAQNSDVDRFTVKVRATATDRATGATNEYILDSEYSEEAVYLRANTVAAPVITKSFEDKVYQGEPKSISWNVDNFVQYYEVWLDGRALKRVELEEYETLTNYTFDLSIYAISDSLNKHEVQVVAVPKSQDVSQVITQRSNIISYAVYKKLGTVDSTSISIGKEGNYLVVSWREVPSAMSYSIEIQGKESASDPYRMFNSQTGIIGTRYTLDLETINTSYQDVQARIKACGQSGGYVEDAEFSEWSEALQVIW